MGVHAKLQSVREEFSKMDLKKSGRNDFSKYTYFELADFLPAAQLHFSKVGLCPVTTFPAEHTGESTAYRGVLTIYDNDDPSQTVVFESPMVIPSVKGMNESQALGAAETYIRRYLYQAALELSEHDQFEDPAAAEEIARLKNEITELGASLSAADKHNKARVAELIRSRYGSVKYREMKPGDEKTAREIIDELKKLKTGSETGASEATAEKEE